MPDSLLPLGRFFKPALKLLRIRKARGPALIDAARAVHGKFGSISHTQLHTKAVAPHGYYLDSRDVAGNEDVM